MKALLAIYWHSDEEGLFCHATNAQIADSAGPSAETVSGYLSVLERDRVVAWADVQRAGQRRTLVFVDHPHASDYIRPDWGHRPERDYSGPIPS